MIGHWPPNGQKGEKMIEFRYDTQLLIEGEHLDEDAINDYFTEHLKSTFIPMNLGKCWNIVLHWVKFMTL